MTAIVLLALLAATVASLAAPLMRQVGFAVGAIDRPGHRKVHEVEVSRLGGVTVWGAFVATAIVAERMGVLDAQAFTHAGVAWPLLALGAALLAAIGVVDDVRSMGAHWKLLVQIVAACLVVASGCVIREATNPLTGTSLQLGWLGAPVTICWVIGITNALNLIDGLDGLAAGVGLIVSTTLCVISFFAGRADVALLAGVLAGALVGFLYFNFNPATIFLGDSGSLFLGYALAVLSIEAAHKGTTAVLLMAPILALGIPIMETMLTVLRRLLVSASIMQADRDHIHHRLLALGLSHRRAVLVLYAACLLLNLAAVFTARAATRDTALVAVAVALATFLGVRKLRYHDLGLPGMAAIGQHALLALADAASLIVAYAVAVLALHGGSLPPNAGIDVLRAATVAGVLELCVLLLSGVYRDEPGDPSRGPWRTLGVSLVLGAIVASAGLYATRTAHFFDPTTLALDLILSAALLAALRGAAHLRRRMIALRAPAGAVTIETTPPAEGTPAAGGRDAA
ncbi:MAG TPA: MraY family glycosyltransferase [Candidatus Eisenbacteria bacterium]|nr:MraY family glycosyltransferase [Candidatus Eisenbacteria bacterium]